jgi:hypothetical protein
VRTYYVDGAEFRSGIASTISDETRILLIGDGGSSTGRGHGSMIVDWVRIRAGIKPVLTLGVIDGVPNIGVSGGDVRHAYTFEYLDRLPSTQDPPTEWHWPVLKTKTETSIPFQTLDLEPSSTSRFYRVRQELPIGQTPICR